MLTCRDAKNVVKRDALATLPWPERLAVRFHLVLCPPCRLFRRQISGLDSGAKAVMAGRGRGSSKTGPDAGRDPSDVTPPGDPRL
jgi:hypothetical protein